jgi:transcription elongation factor Elf1
MSDNKAKLDEIAQVHGLVDPEVAIVSQEYVIDCPVCKAEESVSTEVDMEELGGILPNCSCNQCGAKFYAGYEVSVDVYLDEIKERKRAED